MCIFGGDSEVLKPFGILISILVTSEQLMKALIGLRSVRVD